MGLLQRLYHPSLSMLTDLYELTMAYGYWKSGLAEREAVFSMVFRTLPFGGGFAVCCGLEPALEYLSRFSFSAEDVDYLRTLKGNDGRPLFDQDFLTYLREMRLRLDVDAIPEGTIVFPHEPLLRIQGPLLQCQIVEPALLNLVNFQTLIATKAARICLAAQGDPVVDFGLRRAQGIDGSLSAARAAYIGGCAGTSNVLAGQLYGIPVSGTMAHSWVMSFEDELSAFRAYAEALPNNGVFLVDTYNSIEGIRHAITIGLELRQRGHRLIGIRLDSGDLAYLSIEARRMLDEAGLPEAVIAASNELDEHTIESLKKQGARINFWGVGTRLITAADDPALGGIYKLSALRDASGAWQYKVKLSEQVAKTSTPGILQVLRFEEGTEYRHDMIYDEMHAPAQPNTVMVDPKDQTRRKAIVLRVPHEALLLNVMKQGEVAVEAPGLAEIRSRTLEQLGRFYPGIKRLLNPHEYPVGLEQRLYEIKTRLVLKARGM